MKIIGVAGAARAGKDTIASWFIVERNFVRYAFADSLKESAARTFGIPTSAFYDERKEQRDEYWGRSPREIAQLFGTESMRSVFGDDVWIKILERRIFLNAGYSDDARIVIPDVRFENEAAFCRKHGELIHVVRPGADGNVGVVGHASERGIQVDYDRDTIVLNTGTVAELHNQLEQLFPQRVAA